MLPVVLGSLAGANWIRVVGGELEYISSYKPLPDPIKDEDMLPFWRHPSPGEKESAHTLFDFDKLEDHSSPGISISHLCGYYYTPESYQMYGERLQSYGFEIMRSRRGSDAKYWEKWWLPGLWCAEGDLAEAIGKEQNDKKALKRAVDFLAKNISFGTLDVSVQRLAMQAPD